MSGILVAVVLVVAAFATFWLIGERGRLVLPSTRGFMQSAGILRAMGPTGLHGYVYGRWTRGYLRMLGVAMHTLGVPFRRWVANHYHGKVLSHEHARAIVELNCPVPLTDLEQIVPYPAAREIVLSASPDVVAYECACRGISPNPCQPTQVCMVVGKPMTDFILEHHPGEAKRLTRDEALSLLEGEHERGHVHSAWFKDACMGRFYAICNCCKCCCGGIHAMRRYDTRMIAPSGYVCRVDDALCTACGACVSVCPFDAISLDGTAKVNWDACMGCGACETACAQHALSLARDEGKGEPLDVRTLASAPAPAPK